MKDFNYFELIASFYYSIFDQVKQGTSLEMSVNQSFDDFWLYPEFDHRLSNLVMIIHYLHAKYSLDKSFTQKQIEIYRKQIELVKNDDFSKWLDQGESNHFTESIEILNSEIESYLS